MKVGRLTDTEFSLSPSLFTGSHCSFSLMLYLIELNQKTISNLKKKNTGHISSSLPSTGLFVLL